MHMQIATFSEHQFHKRRKVRKCEAYFKKVSKTLKVWSVDSSEMDWIHKTLFTSKLKICQGKLTPEKTMNTTLFELNIYNSIGNRCARTQTVHCKSLRNVHNKGTGILVTLFSFVGTQESKGKSRKSSSKGRTVSWHWKCKKLYSYSQ